MGDYTQEHVNVLGQGSASLRFTVNGMTPVAIPNPAVRTNTATWPDVVTLANTNAERLQALINRAHRDGGGTVYFPPGRYLIGRNDLAYGLLSNDSFDVRAAIDWSQTTDVPDVLVYADVTLRFAPEAVLVPMNFLYAGREHWRAIEGCSAEDPLVRIEIQGGIIADLREIFATNLHPRVDQGPTEPFLPAGKILLTGNRVREVYPEWWGTESTENERWPLRHQHALQAAIDAAHTDRHRPRRTRNGSLALDAEGYVRWTARATIPLVAVGQYGIAGGLQVGETDAVMAADDPRLRLANPSPFVLRGEREAHHNAAHTFYATTASDEPMLDLRGASSVIDKVSFDGNHLSRSLVRVATGDGGLCTFEGCTFYSVRQVEGAVAVRLESPLRFVPVGVQRPDEGAQRAVEIAFTRCRLQGISPSDQPTGQAPVPPNMRVYPRRISALSIDVDDRVGVEVRNCFLLGIADPLIRAIRGHFALNEATFHASRGVNPPLPNALEVDAVRRFLNSADGTDIFIEAPRRYSVGSDAPASFTAREVESQSFQFLATYQASDGAPSGGVGQSSPSTGARSACVLLNVHHGAAVLNSNLRPDGSADGGGVDAAPFDARNYRPSIYWDGPAQRGAELVAVGCKFRWDYWGTAWADDRRPGWVRVTGGTMGGIQVGHLANAPVYHLGNTLLASFTAHVVSSVATLQPTRIVATDGPSLQLRTLPLGTLQRSGR